MRLQVTGEPKTRTAALREKATFAYVRTARALIAFSRALHFIVFDSPVPASRFPGRPKTRFWAVLLAILAAILAAAADKPHRVVLPGPESWPCQANFRIVDGADMGIVEFAKKNGVPPLMLLAWNPVLSEEGRVKRFRETRAGGRTVRSKVRILLCREPFLRIPLGDFESPYKLVLKTFAEIYPYPWAELGSRWRADVPPGKRVRMGPETCLTFARKPRKMRLRLDLPAPERTQLAVEETARVFGLAPAALAALNPKAMTRAFLTREDVLFLPFPRLATDTEPLEDGEGVREPVEPPTPADSLEPAGGEGE